MNLARTSSSAAAGVSATKGRRCLRSIRPAAPLPARQCSAHAKPASGWRCARRSSEPMLPPLVQTLRRGPICPLTRAAATAGPQAADLNEILEERDACGVGFIASLKNEKTHETMEKALLALGCMEHRGACSADNDSGDGAGVMSQIPWDILRKEFPSLDEATTGVGMIFLPNDDELEAQAKAIAEDVCQKEGLEVLGWRDVPVDPSVVGRFSTDTMPRIKQILVKAPGDVKGDDFERELFIARKLMEDAASKKLGEKASDFYICTLSNRIIVYKGMLRSVVLKSFYKDLTNPDFTTAFAIYHRRFSTNTTPKWPLAQPMRFLGHNGEINTLQGNLNWVASREHTLKHPVWNGREEELMPLCNSSASDSANLDRLAELMVRSGSQPAEAVMVLVPEAYRNHPDLMKEYPEVVDFYEFYEGLQEGWDGPALLVFSDGVKLGARLDRNGLRPARYWETSDGYAYVASEVGVLGDTISNAENVIRKGRLGPGQMVYVDLSTGKFMENSEVAKTMAGQNPYKDWLSNSEWLSDIAPQNFYGDALMDSASLIKLQTSHGMGLEDSTMIIHGMAAAGVEPTYCMGDDTPLPVISDTPQMIYNYFKQRFAQVTNPPIDSLREGLVMSLEMRLGARGNLLEPGPESYKQIKLKSPIVSENQLEAIKGNEGLGTQTFNLAFKSGEEGALEAAIKKLCSDVEKAVEAGCQCIVLSDRLPEGEEMDIGAPPMPALLAVGAVHHHLIQTSLRTDTSIVVETAQCFSTHHLAVLVGYGAHAVCPYMAFESCRQWRLSPRTTDMVKSGKIADISVEDTQKNYKKAIEKGLLKILSKMGISLLSCYHGAQIFEIYGLGKDVIETCFRGSVSRIGGLTLNDVQKETESLWAKGFPEGALKKLNDYGFIRAKPKGEYHVNSMTMAKLLHKSIGLGGDPGNKEAFEAYMEHFENSPVAVLRDCLELVSDREPIPIEEVEDEVEIMKRFCTGGMSLGAISRETHETIAIAMNRIGGRSNSGEGGEDPVRWEKLNDCDEDGKSDTFPYLNGLQNGDVASSAIKQVASGRFGVTPSFLVNSEQLEIKIAQGAKPGEGGQLPGKKVSPYIAGLRKSKPGVPLISPPPHHDIYSIEDLAQLIYDLHMVSPQAKVSVKLVAEAGIGTVASGVAKANADIIQISGHDGGTGASPISSIKHAGGPVEMGLAEVNQSLVENELRDRVVLRVDGGIRTGRDVVVTAAMGADEYGFGTTAMIATGCIMARICHTNNCPVGVATQREDLRKKFPGTPGDLVNYFHFVASEVRVMLAELGYKSMDDLIGRADLLKQRDISLAKTTNLDLSFLTSYPGPSGQLSSERRANLAHSNGDMLFDDEVLKDPEVISCIENQSVLVKEYEMVNTDRSAMSRIAGVIAKKYGEQGFDGMLEFQITGVGGQSFCCFLVDGMRVHLVGEANDYVGKGMAGGVISIVPPPNVPFDAEDASLVGNTCLYGATGGQLFVRGRAGERFAVRNSMTDAVVEGAGDHCCEYMTGGTVAVLGTVGRNAAAGMTGGLAYFFDEEGDFPEKVNTEIVAIQRVRTRAGSKQLKELIQKHVELTGSSKGKAILDTWDDSAKKFWQLVPPSEKNTAEVNPSVESKEAELNSAEQSVSGVVASK